MYKNVLGGVDSLWLALGAKIRQNRTEQIVFTGLPGLAPHTFPYEPRLLVALGVYHFHLLLLYTLVGKMRSRSKFLIG